VACRLLSSLPRNFPLCGPLSLDGLAVCVLRAAIDTGQTLIMGKAAPDLRRMSSARKLEDGPDLASLGGYYVTGKVRSVLRIFV